MCNVNLICIFYYSKRTISPMPAMSTPRSVPHQAPQGALESQPNSGGGISSPADWDINDTAVPKVSSFDTFNEWADGHCRLVYPPHSEEAKRHASGKQKYIQFYITYYIYKIMIKLEENDN